MPKSPAFRRSSEPRRSELVISDRTRLHITPFDSKLLPLVIGASDLPTASNVSYHTLQSFPEKRYGFIELPAMTAEKVKKKLNGSILKGSKMRVDVARPEPDRPGVGASDDAQAPSSRSAESGERRSKRQKREDKVVPGVELPEGRKVQRGWTQPATPKSKTGKPSKEKKGRTQTSSYGTEPECLFKTTLPANTAAPRSHPEKQTRKGERRSKDKAGRDTVVHEFSSTTKHASFLRDSKVPKGGKVVSQYVDGKGWVDEEGNLIEEVKKRSLRTDNASKPSSNPKKTSAVTASATDTSQNQKISKDEEDDDGDEQTSSSGDDSAPPSDTEDTSSEGSSAGSEEMDGSKSSNQENIATAENLPVDEDITPRLTRPRGLSSTGVVPGLSITIPTNDMQTDANQPHPLESLFKRPANKATAPSGKSTEAETTFSFFEPDAESGVPMPQTPFTLRDFHERGQRSAAPTPDTAAPGRRFSFAWRQGEEEDSAEDDDDGMEDLAEDDESDAQQEKPGSMLAPPAPQENGSHKEKGFEETFWEKRGETNRAWKKRRRETGKERKKRENKRLGSRLV